MTKEEIIDFCEMKSQLEPENEDIFNYIIKILESYEDAVSKKAALETLNSINGTAEFDKAFELIENLPPMIPIQEFIPVINVDDSPFNSVQEHKNCGSCGHYGLHHKTCDYCYKYSLWTEKKSIKRRSKK